MRSLIGRDYAASYAAPVLSLLLSLLIVSSAQAITLTIDDITTDRGCCGLVPDGYGGLHWVLVYVIDATDNENPAYANSGYRHGTVSGKYVAFNPYEREVTISGSPFDFNSVYLTAAWNDGLNIRVRGLSSGNQLYDDTVTVDTTGPALFNFNYLGIDQLIFNSFGGVPNPALGAVASSS